MGSAIENMFSGGASSALPAEAAGMGGISSNLNNVGQQVTNLLSPYMSGNMQNPGQLLSPWINQTNTSMDAYNQALNSMRNPQQFISNMMQGYQQSPAAQYAQQQGIKAANAAGAVTGMAGSGPEQIALQRLGQGITQQDQQNYLNNMMNTYGQYLGGLSGESQQGLNASSDLSHMGLGASTDLASVLSSLGMKQADIGLGQQQIAAQGKEAQTQGKDSGIGGALGAGTGLVSDAKNGATGGLFGF